MTTEENQPAAEVTISEMRAMLGSNAPQASQDDATPAATEQVARTPESASDPTKATQAETPATERGPDGKFKPKAEVDASAEAGDENLTPNVQKRIAKAVKAQREAERRAQELEAKLNGNQESRPATENAPVQKEAPKSPQAEDFATYEEFTRATARYEAEQTHASLQAKQREEAEKATRHEAEMARHKAFDEAETKILETHPDYHDVTAAIEWPKQPAMRYIADYLLDTQNASLMYQLGKQPAELQRIAALPPVQAVAELGKFEAKLTAPPAPKAKRELPKPPANVGGSTSAVAEDINDPSLDMATFKRLMKSSLAS